MKHLLKDSHGMALVIVVFMVSIFLTLTGASLLFSQLDLKMTSNHKTGIMAFHVAETGISHAIQELGDGNGTNDFDTVASAASSTTVISNVSFGAGSYTIIGEPVPGSSPVRVKVTSTGCLPAVTGAAVCPSGNSKAVLQAELKPFGIPLPGAITLIGNNANFTGGQSNAKTLSGDEGTGCGSTPSKPVIAVTDAASKASVQTEINNSKPNTYSTSYPQGKTDDIVASGEVNNIKMTYGFDYTNVNDLKVLVKKLENRADSVVSGGATGVDLGSPGQEKIVVVNGDFVLSASNGAGILVVKGNLTFNGNISYTGVILVIGTGVMQRNGGGSGTIKGGILVAKVVGPDGIYGTADDVIGSTPTLNTSGGGNSDILYCSAAVNKGFSKLLEMLSWMHVF